MIIPDPFAKTVKLPIRIVDGRAEYFYGGPFPKISNVIGDLVVPAFSLLEDQFLEECSQNDVSNLLPEETTLMVNVWAEWGTPGLCKNVTTGTLSGNVEVRLLEPLYLWHRGTKSSVLNRCKCYIPALKEEASSLNHAYTIISKKFETKRQTNSGNVFKKVYYPTDTNVWKPLERLREKHDAWFEQRFVANLRQEKDSLDFSNAQSKVQSVLCSDETGSMLAVIDPDGLTLEEYENGEKNEQGPTLTVRTHSPNMVLFELLKERFTTAVEFESWLVQKKIPVDLRSGFPTETIDLSEYFDEIVRELFENDNVEPTRTDSIDLGLILGQFDDEARKVIVGKESSESLDQFLAEGWIHTGEHLIRKPFYPYKSQGIRNIPVRVRLSEFSLSKHQRRVLKKNTDVRIDVRPLAITRQDEELFDRHKQRFGIAPPKSIYDVIPISPFTEIRKITVTEENRLIGVSYLDVGTTSTYSIYAMFEPSIEWRSLGILTILKEIEFSISEGKEFYYLGFVYAKPSFYDYKKHLRGLEIFDWRGNWSKPVELSHYPE